MYKIFIKGHLNKFFIKKLFISHIMLHLESGINIPIKNIFIYIISLNLNRIIRSYVSIVIDSIYICKKS